MNKQLLSFVLFLSLLVAATSCKKKDNGPSTTANVMFVNGCAGADAVDASVNANKVSNGTALKFLASSGYRPIAGGAADISFLLTSTQTKISGGAVTLTAGLNYSAFVGGIVTGGTSAFVLTTDDLTAPSSGKAKVRFVNLCPDPLQVTYAIGTSNIDSNITYQTVSQFKEITPGSFNIKAGDPSNIGSVITSTVASQFNAGKIYTIMFTGTTAGSGTAALGLIVIGNN